MNNPNDRQVGGEHYRKGGKRQMQHWDLMAALDIGYFPAVITKYVERHEEKAGRLDLEKAVHYAEKYHETESHRREMGSRRMIRMDGGAQEEMVAEYVAEAGLTGIQALIFHTALLRPENTDYLINLCKKYLDICYPGQSIGASGAQTSDALEKQISDASDLMKRDLTAERPGTPEDGGQHAKIPVLGISDKKNLPKV